MKRLKIVHRLQCPLPLLRRRRSLLPKGSVNKSTIQRSSWQIVVISVVRARFSDEKATSYHQERYRGTQLVEFFWPQVS